MAKKSKTARLARALRKQARSPRVRYLALTTGAAFLAERATRTALIGGWRLARGEDPPRNPERLDVGWGEALAWTAAMGIAMATAGLLARRGAAVGWKRYVRRPIPVGAGRA
jgi:hypothetical protein